MRFRIIHGENSFLELRDSYELLREQTPEPSFFQSSEWILAWMKHFGQHGALAVVITERSDGELCSALPLFIEEIGFRPFRYKRATIVGTSNHLTDYANFLHSEKQVISCLPKLNSVLETLKVDLLLLRNIREDALLSSAPSRNNNIRRFLYDAPAWRYGDAVADQKLENKKSLKRHYNYFARQGEIALLKLDAANCADQLEEFYSQHISRREHAGDRSNFLDPEMRSFFKEMLNAEAASFFAVSCGDRNIAYHYGFEEKGRFFWYKPSFDVALVKHSPGEVLIKLLLERARTSAFNYFDFTVGSEGFKYRFSNQTPKVYEELIFRDAASAQLYRLLSTSRTALGKIRRAIRQNFSPPALSFS